MIDHLLGLRDFVDGGSGTFVNHVCHFVFGVLALGVAEVVRVSRVVTQEVSRRVFFFCFDCFGDACSFIAHGGVTLHGSYRDDVFVGGWEVSIKGGHFGTEVNLGGGSEGVV